MPLLGHTAIFCGWVWAFGIGCVKIFSIKSYRYWDICKNLLNLHDEYYLEYEVKLI